MTPEQELVSVKNEILSTKKRTVIKGVLYTIVVVVFVSVITM